MAKLSNTTAAVFEFIHDQTTQPKAERLHEFEIVARFKNIIGHGGTLDVIDRLYKKHHILRSTSTKKISSGRETYYYRANPENPYFDTGRGRRTSPEVMKKLEKLRGSPIIHTEDKDPGLEHVNGATGSKEALEELFVKQQDSASTSLTKSAPESSVPPQMAELVQGISKEEGDNSVSLLLDLGNSKTEIVDVRTAYKLYLGLKTIFELK